MIGVLKVRGTKATFLIQPFVPYDDAVLRPMLIDRSDMEITPLHENAETHLPPQ